MKAILAAIFAIVVNAQTPPAFEVASIHSSRADQSSAQLGFSGGWLSAANTSNDQLKLMPQTLLADRFQLKTHREMRPIPVNALVVAKSGPRLQTPKPGERRHIESYPGFMTGTNVPMSSLIDTYSCNVNRPVIDKTEFSDHFDFTLRWTPDVPGQAEFPLEALVLDRVEQPSAN